MIKGIIFDLDGTIIDSMGIWAGIDRQFLKENGIENPPPDISDKLKRMSVDESSSYLINLFGLDFTVSQVSDRIEELVKEQYEKYIELKPNVIKLLSFLDERNIPYGVATATYKKLAFAVLERHGILKRFRFILTDMEYPRGKKFPDIFIGASELLGLSPQEVLVAEDSLYCISTAKGAGFKTAGIYDDLSANDRSEIERIADYYFETVDGIINIL